MHTNKLISNLLFIAAIFILLLFTFWFENHYLLISFAVVLIAMLFLLFRFEQRKVEARELVLLAVLAAIASVSRIPFASLPSVQPTTFVIIMAGYVFGAESGFIIGTVAALASNMILGQGPWTPWQMAAWGLVGFSAGHLRHRWFMQTQWGRAIFGFIWGFLFGWIMNIWGFAAFIQLGNPISMKTIIAYFAGSALFDFFHALSNVFFLLLFGNSWIKSLSRFRKKYGLMQD